MKTPTFKNIGGSKKRMHGVSLVEIMVALTIGLILLGGVTVIMVSSSNTSREMDLANRQIENGRYAMQKITEDVRMAGFYGAYYSVPAASSTPDPCTLTATAFKAALPVAIQGYDAPVASPLSCISNHLSGTDVLVVRRVSSVPYFWVSGTTFQNSSGASLDTNTLYLQATIDDVKVDTGANAANFTLTRKDAATKIEVSKAVTRIYWVSSCNVPASGSICNGSTDDGGKSIPTLKMAELDTGPAYRVYSLAEGIENIQYDYGVDTDGDGTADEYVRCTSLESSACSDYATTNSRNWSNVVSIRINLLARNPEASRNYSDDKTYDLGLHGTITPSSVASTDPDYLNYKRHLYTAAARVINVSSRREK